MKKPLGVLLLHGFTGLPETVNGLVPHLEAEGLPYRMPAMRGHFTKPEDLVGVTWRDWVDDAAKALDDLFTEVDRVVIVALSMGCLVALKIAMERPQNLAGMVLVAPALRFADPLTAFTPLLSMVAKFWPMPKPPKECAYEAKNYPYFPTKTFASFQDFTRHIEVNLPQVQVPVCLMHSKTDKTIQWISSQIIHDRVASTDKALHWFEHSGHEMMMDREKERVFDLTMAFIRARTPAVEA
ncbi:MAG TPA: alpha/beta fold hydrolase [Stenomitos sp.]